LRRFAVDQNWVLSLGVSWYQYAIVDPVTALVYGTLAPSLIRVRPSRILTCVPLGIRVNSLVLVLSRFGDFRFLYKRAEREMLLFLVRRLVVADGQRVLASMHRRLLCSEISNVLSYQNPCGVSKSNKPKLLFQVLVSVLLFFMQPKQQGNAFLIFWFVFDMCC
jgi:hypothetical protein